ncbi:hypothetical protein GCM10009530_17520 [Microbispora corallina]|uniref:Tox-PL domain-containing protein n=1 Tax=Microbispora corallina TaxID=83302 RepID=A0ABQ4FY43_9ACTN|nr:hypothetical protein Mco01_27110 [Microbispora corallina]
MPSGVYNPVVTADGRRWRDYEQAAEAPAPSLEDRRMELLVPALTNGAQALGVAVAHGRGNGVTGGNGTSPAAVGGNAAGDAHDASGDRSDADPDAVSGAVEQTDRVPEETSAVSGDEEPDAPGEAPAAAGLPMSRAGEAQACASEPGEPGERYEPGETTPPAEACPDLAVPGALGAEETVRDAATPAPVPSQSSEGHRDSGLADERPGLAAPGADAAHGFGEPGPTPMAGDGRTCDAADGRGEPGPVPMAEDGQTGDAADGGGAVERSEAVDAGDPDGDEEPDLDEHDRTGSDVPVDALGESAEGQGAAAYDALAPVGDGDGAGAAVPVSARRAGQSAAEAAIATAYPLESVRPADEFPLSGLAVPPRQAVQPDGVEPDVMARARLAARVRQPEEAEESTAVRAETPTDPLPYPLAAPVAADHREPGFAAPPHGPAPTADPDLPARVAHQPSQSVRRTPVADAVRAFKAEAMAAAYDDTADAADAAAEDATQDVVAANPDGSAGGGTAVPHGPEAGTDRLPGGRMGDLMADLLGSPARPEPRSAHPELTARPLPGLNGDPLADALAAKLFTQVEGLWTTAFDEAERDWLDRSSRPPRLEHTRPYGRPGGLAEPDPETRQSLVQAVSGRFPDPRGTWIRLINAEGPSEDPFRSNNAVDCALSVMSTWHGEPVVAARRLPEFDPNGRPLLTGETGGVTRAEEWLGQRFEYVGHGRRAYVAIAQRLIFGGHGAAAVLITRWPGGGSHAWNAVNCRGEVLWIDAQRGHMALEPPYEDVTGVFAVVIDRQGQRL